MICLANMAILQWRFDTIIIKEIRLIKPFHTIITLISYNYQLHLTIVKTALELGSNRNWPLF